MNGASQPHRGDWYEIRIKGHLANRWAAWLDGESLNNLRDLGLPLISVAQADRGSAVPPSSEAPLTQNRSTT
jgi:hypothetical protein